MRQWTYKVLVAAVIASTLWACGTAKRVGNSGNVNIAVAHKTSPEFDYVFMEAIRQENAGHYAAAFDLFQHAMEMDSLSAETYYFMAPYYYDLDEMKGDSIALTLLKKAVALNPGNPNYHERLAQGYIHSQDYDSAIEAYEALYSANRNRSDVLEILLQLYQQKKNYRKMLSTIDRMEEVEGTSEEITLAKMQVYQMQGDKQAAYKSLRQLVEDHPNDVNYKVMLGNWLEQNDRRDEALEMFKAAENDDPSNEFAAESLYDYYHLEGNDSLANIYRDRILFNKYASIRTRLQVMHQLIRENVPQHRDSTEVLNLFYRMMDVDKENADIAALAVTYMQITNMPDSVQQPVLHHIIDIAPDASNARLQLVGMSWKLQDWKTVEELCRPALEYNPDDMTFCYFLGLACYQQDKDDEALEAFRRGVSQINDKSDKNIVSDFYAIMGDILHKKGQNQEAYDAYDNCLKWKPDNVSCLNNYAYYLSIEDDADEEMMRKAELMSLQTVNAEPENSTYLDTYAWILFLEERYAEAKVYIDKTVEHLDEEYNNATIYEHAGDIYYVLGNTSEAKAFWQKALDEGSSNEAELKTKMKKM